MADDVLVVEDDTQINELVGAYVQIAGYEYRSALDGAGALAAVRERLPSLIILDLMLPDTDGFEVCKQLKSDEYRVRYETLTAVRKSTREELAEPNFAQLRARIEKVVNQLLADAPIQDIGFYQLTMRSP